MRKKEEESFLLGSAGEFASVYIDISLLYKVGMLEKMLDLRKWRKGKGNYSYTKINENEEKFN